MINQRTKTSLPRNSFFFHIFKIFYSLFNFRYEFFRTADSHVSTAKESQDRTADSQDSTAQPGHLGGQPGKKLLHQDSGTWQEGRYKMLGNDWGRLPGEDNRDCTARTGKRPQKDQNMTRHDDYDRTAWTRQQWKDGHCTKIGTKYP
jgi:hypothetical protein